MSSSAEVYTYGSRDYGSTSSAFGQLSLNESSRSSQSTDPKDFRDGRSARPSDVFIALMGVTGSGKSSFISLCCQRVAEVGHELRACTTVVDVYAYELSASRTVYLVDTPGFDDTNRSDTEVLREIAGWFNASYNNKVLLHGIIYLHRIADVRMQGSAKKNLLMFKKLCGDDALRKVVLATTMWDKVPQREAEERERQLVETPEFWGFMVSKGSVTYRHNNTVESAVKIIERLARDNSTMTLDLQKQMVNQNQTLVETAAGKELESELIKERQKWAAQLKDAQEQIKEAIRLRDKESEQALQEVKNDFISRMERLERANKRLHVDAERLHNERTERLEKALEQQRKENANILEKLQQRDVQLEEASKNDKKVSTSPLSQGRKKRRDNVSEGLTSSRKYIKEDVKYTPISSMKEKKEVHFEETKASIPETRPRREVQYGESSENDEALQKKSWRSLHYDTSDRGRTFSTSLFGGSWNVMGPISQVSRRRGYLTKMEENDIQFCSYGTENSYIFKLSLAGSGSTIICSSNFHVQYPLLHERLYGWSDFEVHWICLGPGGTFFAKWKHGEYYHLPPAIESQIKAVKNDSITAVALGIDETYIIVHGDQRKWSLKGLYGSLDWYLDAQSTPDLVALNPESNREHIILAGNCLGYYLGDPAMTQTYDNIKKWTKDHGVNWG